MAHGFAGAFTGRQGDSSGARPASELRLRGESEGVADFDEERGCADGSDAGLFAQGRSVLIEERVDVGFEPQDLQPPGSILINELSQPAQAVLTGDAERVAVGEVGEAAQACFDLAAGAEFVTNFGWKLRDLILDVVECQRSHSDQHSTVLENGFDLRDERVVDLECLDRAKGWLGEHRPCGGDGVGPVGLGGSTRPALLRGALRRDFTCVEASGDDRDRDVCTPARRALDANLEYAVGLQALDRDDVAGCRVRACHSVDFDAVGVDDAECEVVLMRVDSRDG